MAVFTILVGSNHWRSKDETAKRRTAKDEQQRQQKKIFFFKAVARMAGGY